MRRVGPRAVLLDVADALAAAATASRVRDLVTQGLVPEVSVVPGACTVLVEALDGPLVGVELLAGIDVSAAGEDVPAVVVEVPTTWDGADLDDVADRWGCSRTEAVARLEGRDFVSAFCGFAPGFAYLGGLPPEWAVPRLGSPRTRVPAGSVAIADTWMGVYPRASPGGWRLLGSTDLELFDVAADPPALLAPGTRVRFVGR